MMRTGDIKVLRIALRIPQYFYNNNTVILYRVSILPEGIQTSRSDGTAGDDRSAAKTFHFSSTEPAFDST